MVNKVARVSYVESAQEKIKMDLSADDVDDDDDDGGSGDDDEDYGDDEEAIPEGQ